MQTAVQYATKAVSPAFAIANKVKAKAVKSNNLRPTDILERQAVHKLAGTDMAAESSKKFFRDQWNLIGYRVERMYLEADAVYNGAWFNKAYNLKCFVQDFRTATHMLFIFLFTRMWFRVSIFPPLEPDSPLHYGRQMAINP